MSRSYGGIALGKWNLDAAVSAVEIEEVNLRQRLYEFYHQIEFSER